ncbi:Fe-S oxidoreductase [Candidatus Syntrophocurvum alkaliphilum]|uniref:Fe-S oxidoreductase n=1 Tax=Candidatus Syntrophocurvum alkaliphilum TaxID=2293317 RepID=A0A6I6DBC3_9FIRM|nr:TIGR03960 family B12-binding radical SAM protein [Candidatus Syntrophocurvum alkaliphilum]QGU00039.1 Fe-S oxidoreductase [Candidatus Syntrophocurvum alkaliphilum]
MKDKLFKNILPKVSKPARYTGNEINIIKKDWDKAQIKMVFAFPDVYEVGMSHVGSKILYGLINEKTNHIMERTFAPWPDMEKVMREDDIPLYSLESYKPICQFDVIGFSLQYELSITNVLNMLNLGDVPIFNTQRGEEHPIVIAGGPVVFNPEPFADFFDAFLIGDGEELLPDFLDELYQNKQLSRYDKLIKLSQVEGVYVPSLYSVEYNTDGTINSFKPNIESVPTTVRKRIVKNFDESYFPDKPIVPYMEVVHDRAVLEVMRGCHRACRFCHAGTVYRPVREKGLNTLKEQAQNQLCNTGFDEISLSSLSTLDYSRVDKLVKDLIEQYGDKGIGVSLPSLRVDAFSIELANEVQKVRKTTLTLALEAGTQRLRNVINKNVNEDDLFKAVEAAFKSGWLSLKFYFMLGLPTETEEDLNGILILIDKIRAIGKEHAKKNIEIRASLSNFVPKAHTPFQWHLQDSMEEIEAKKKYLKSKKRKNVKLSFSDSRTSYLEGVFSRGDRQIARVIHSAWQKGCKFDGWSEYFKFEPWLESFKEHYIDPNFYTVRKRSYEEITPWDFIDIGVSEKYLQIENEKAIQEAQTPNCRDVGCVGCGICPSFEVEMEIEEEGKNAAESRI